MGLGRVAELVKKGVRGSSSNGSSEDELGCWPGDPSTARFADAELSSRSGGCGVPASLSSLPPARSLSELSGKSPSEASDRAKAP